MPAVGVHDPDLDVAGAARGVAVRDEHDALAVRREGRAAIRRVAVVRQAPDVRAVGAHGVDRGSMSARRARADEDDALAVRGPGGLAATRDEAPVAAVLAHRPDLRARRGGEHAGVGDQPAVGRRRRLAVIRLRARQAPGRGGPGPDREDVVEARGLRVPLLGEQQVAVAARERGGRRAGPGERERHHGRCDQGVRAASFHKLHATPGAARRKPVLLRDQARSRPRLSRPAPPRPARPGSGTASSSRHGRRPRGHRVPPMLRATSAACEALMTSVPSAAAATAGGAVKTMCPFAALGVDRRDRLRAGQQPLLDGVGREAACRAPTTRSYAAAAAAAFPSATLRGKRARIAVVTDSSVTMPQSAAKPPSSAAFGERPADVLPRELGGRDGEHVEVEVAEAELLRGAARVDQHGAAGPHPAEEVDLVQQRGVLHDQRVGLHDRLADADGAVVDAAERDHRRGAEPSSGTPARGAPPGTRRARATRPP